MERYQITNAIKTRLTECGYPVKSVKWATGTARWWIHIKVDLPWNSDYSAINRIAEEIKGDGQINISYAL